MSAKLFSFRGKRPAVLTPDLGQTSSPGVIPLRSRSSCTLDCYDLWDSILLRAGSCYCCKVRPRDLLFTLDHVSRTPLKAVADRSYRSFTSWGLRASLTTVDQEHANDDSGGRPSSCFSSPWNSTSFSPPPLPLLNSPCFPGYRPSSRVHGRTCHNLSGSAPCIVCSLLPLSLCRNWRGFGRELRPGWGKRKRGRKFIRCPMRSCGKVSTSIWPDPLCGSALSDFEPGAELIEAVGGLASDLVPMLAKTNDPKGAEETLKRNVEDGKSLLFSSLRRCISSKSYIGS